LSKIIRRSELSEPAVLKPYQLPKLKGEPSPRGVCSLEFITSAREEINAWRAQFSEHRDAREKIHEAQIEQAYREGYERGFSEGALRERSGRIEAIDILLREAKRKKEHAVRDIEAKVLDLAVNIAGRIINRSLAADPEIAADIVRQAMSNIIGGEMVILKVSEEDFPKVNERYDEWLGMTGNAREFRIETDKLLRRGDCVVETEGGIIDAILSSRLEYLVEELLKI